MLIVLACDVPLAHNNGTAVAGINLKNALESRGHQVRLLCPGQAPEAPYGTQAINFGPLNPYVAKNGVVISKPSRDTVIRALEGAEHLHIMTPFFLCGTAVRRAKELGLSITAGFHAQAENITSHLFLMNCGWVNRQVYRILWKRVFQYADYIHYPTQFIRDTVEQAIGHGTKGEVISNGVGPSFVPGREPKPPELAGKFVVLFAGRYSREKSHALLIRAAARSRHRRDIQLILAGEGPQERRIRFLCWALRVPKPMLGFVDQKELVRRIHYADLYVHPSEIEIEAIACLEAIRGGLVPVVSDSRRSATRFFALWPENSFRCGSARDLAARIDYWIENPERLAECARAYDSYAARFDRAHCMAAMERMLLQTAAGGKAKGHGEKDALLH